jgi:hypothetical protein
MEDIGADLLCAKFVLGVFQSLRYRSRRLSPYRQRRPNRVSAPGTASAGMKGPLSRTSEWGLFNSSARNRDARCLIEPFRRRVMAQSSAAQ